MCLCLSPLLGSSLLLPVPSLTLACLCCPPHTSLLALLPLRISLHCPPSFSAFSLAPSPVFCLPPALSCSLPLPREETIHRPLAQRHSEDQAPGLGLQQPLLKHLPALHGPPSTQDAGWALEGALGGGWGGKQGSRGQRLQLLALPPPFLPVTVQRKASYCGREFLLL